MSAGLFDMRVGAVLTAVVILSMALTPVVVILLNRLTPPENTE